MAMERILRELFELLRLRGDLLRELDDEITAAERSSWAEGAVNTVKVDARRIITLGSRFSTYLLVPAVVLLVVAIAFLASRHSRGPYGFGYSLVAILEAVLGVCALILFWPLVGILRTLRRLPDGVYRELIQPLWVNLDLLNITINASALLFVFFSVRTGASTPFLVILGLLWLFGPLALFLSRQGGTFVKVRIAQLVAVFCAALFFAVSPVPSSQFEWWAQKEMANRMRVADQDEITSQWANLQWFTPEGMPLVWYSYRTETGYHLFSSPGHDPQTNMELREVADDRTKESILSDFRAREANTANSLAQQAAEEKAVERKRIAREYVYSRFASGAAHGEVAIVAFDTAGREDRALAQRFSAEFESSGYKTVAGVFTPAFVSSNVFRSLRAGNQPNAEFPIQNYSRELLVLQPETTTGSERVAGNDLIRATTIVKVRLIDSETGSILVEERLIGQGVAFSVEDAQSTALQKAEAQIPALVGKLKKSR